MEHTALSQTTSESIQPLAVEKLELNKYHDYSWDFRLSDTKEFTHCFHNYPAMMIPQVARRLLQKYGMSAKTLLDPFCGTGTSLVEANLIGIEAIGFDLNPLALMISKAKTAAYDLHQLKTELDHYTDFALFLDKDYDSADAPSFTNIDYWFSKDIQKSLTQLSHFISRVSDDAIRNFFKVAFSETIRESSWTRNSEFKLYRMNEIQISKHKVDAQAIMAAKLTRNFKGLVSFLNVRKAFSQVHLHNSIESIEKNIIEDEKIDIIVTSPPYGDSRTTVAYGQFSRLSNQWLGVVDAHLIDKNLMGGKPLFSETKFNSCALNNAISEISAVDENRVLDVISFFYDYMLSIRNIAVKVKPNGYVCYVVGNRKVKGVVIEMDLITKELFEEIGFKHIETIVRNIPNKRMPSKNSPSNVVGQLDNTMSNEYIVVMRKD